MSLAIYTSNRMEHLLDALADLLRAPLPDPFAPEIIVMQSKGMQRWLSMELASRFGVWANGDYPFPNLFVKQLFDQTITDPEQDDCFSSPVMLWKIFGLLPECVSSDLFAPLRHYLSDDRDDLKRFQLAQKIADSYDQYTLYRPDLLKQWEQEAPVESEQAWQAALWCKLVADSTGRHRGQLKEQFCSLTATLPPDRSRFPQRVALFGISYLPAYHLEVIAAAAERMEINLFLLSPTREYWADILSEKSLARCSAAEREARIEGNPLLASLGRLGKDFSAMTIELATVAIQETDLYAEPDGQCLLHQIQADILNLSGAENHDGKRTIPAGDRSIQIHSCHTPMREVEVLYDQLLSLLEDDPALEPRHILVMTPDIEAYAPYITAVFESGHDQQVRIPYSIADRRLASEGEVASALLQLLALPGSRLTVVQLLDLLSLSPVRRQHGLEEDELGTVRDWLETTRVRWGLDEQDRLDLDLPGYRSHSWRAGLDRLLLGYAMSDQHGELFHDTLPFDDLEGAPAVTLGKLLDFIGMVRRVRHQLEKPRPLPDWCRQLRTLLTECVIADDSTARELSTIGTLIDDLANEGELSHFDGEVPFAVIRSLVTSRLEQEQKGLGFMTGGVTFCAMLPMRSIPFPVIAMIGMNDGAFPRQNPPHGFDLIGLHPRKGDRSLRDEDRYLFLETILSARHSLYISYLGQSIRDNSEIPPSVVVSELLDAIHRAFVPAGSGETIEQTVLTCHRLQPFSRAYFCHHPRLFSYSQENWGALQEKTAAIPLATSFMPTAMAEPNEEWRDVPLPQLLRFIANPARFFCEQRLGIRLKELARALEEREPFGSDGLGSYSLKNMILETLLQGHDPASLLPGVRSQGLLPPARHGDLLFGEHVREVSNLAKSVTAAIGTATALKPLDLDLTIKGFRLYGRLSGIWPDRMYRYRPARLKARDLLSCWIQHLALNAAAPQGYPRETMLLMNGKHAGFQPLDDAADLLHSLLELYWQGLTRPLPFFPESALAYAGASPPWDLGKASGKWNDDSYNDIPGEGSDPYFRLCFKPDSGLSAPFDAEFERISRAVLEPLLRHRS